MKTKNKWTILIATVSVRNAEFERLLTKLMPQVKKYDGDVQVIAYWDNFENPLGTIRQQLLEAAKSDYVSFIDDDDDIPEYYCDEVYPLLDGVDYIGWRMQLYNDGVKAKPTFHSIKYRKWHDDDDGYYRNASHLNPIKRELALMGSFERSVPEDVDWASQVAPYLRSEHYIGKPMYFYIHSTEGSLWDKRKRPIDGATPPVVSYEHFKLIGAHDGNTTH